MFAIIIISVLAAAAGALAIKRVRKGQSRSEPEVVLPRPGFAGLFAHPDVDEVAAPAKDESRLKRRAALIERAGQGDLDALVEAHGLRDRALYREVLDAILAHAEICQEAFPALVSLLTKAEEMRGSARLAALAQKRWQAAPDHRSTLETIHLAALSDDAAAYETAVETALRFWREGRIANMTAQALLALIESQYWALALEARQGGAGFALKRRIAGIRRELAAATTAR